MIIYKDEKIDDFRTLYDKYKLSGLSSLILKCGNINRIKRAVGKLNISGEEITLMPSGKKQYVYSENDRNRIETYLHSIYRSEDIPDGYITKSELINILNVNERTFNSMERYFHDFYTHVSYYYLDNIEHKCYKADDESIKYYKEKKELYLLPYSKRKQIEWERLHPKYNVEEDNEREYVAKYRHHPIAFDYKMMNEIFDTSSPHYSELLRIYRKYAEHQIDNGSIMDKHHIIPQFMKNYKHKDDSENTIYLTKEIHMLVHLLEYKCALPQYKSKLFSSFCILTARIESENIDENIYNSVIKGIIKSLDKY